MRIEVDALTKELKKTDAELAELETAYRKTDEETPESTRELAERWRLNARIENLFDTDYQTAADYRMPERSGFIDLKYSWR